MIHINDRSFCHLLLTCPTLLYAKRILLFTKYFANLDGGLIYCVPYVKYIIESVVEAFDSQTSTLRML